MQSSLVPRLLLSGGREKCGLETRLDAEQVDCRVQFGCCSRRGVCIRVSATEGRVESGREGGGREEGA